MYVDALGWGWIHFHPHLYRSVILPGPLLCYSIISYRLPLTNIFYRIEAILWLLMSEFFFKSEMEFW